MAFISTDVSLPPLLSTSVFHIRSDAGTANADPHCNVSKLIELAAALAVALATARAPSSGSLGDRVSMTHFCLFPFM